MAGTVKTQRKYLKLTNKYTFMKRITFFLKEDQICTNASDTKWKRCKRRGAQDTITFSSKLVTPTDWKLNPSSTLAPDTWKLQNYDCGHGNVKMAVRFFFKVSNVVATNWIFQRINKTSYTFNMTQVAIELKHKDTDFRSWLFTSQLCDIFQVL